MVTHSNKKICIKYLVAIFQSYYLILGLFLANDTNIKFEDGWISEESCDFNIMDRGVTKASCDSVAKVTYLNSRSIYIWGIVTNIGSTKI